MRLLLIRHAQTASNVARALDTAPPGAPLTDLGHQQAARLAAGLAAECLDVVAASPLLRARQTAQPLAAARALAALTLDGLREIEAGDLEMHTAAESVASYRRVIHAWATGELDVMMPGGSSGREFLGRFDEAVRSAGEAGARVAAVSHGAAIRTWVAARSRGVDSAAVSGRTLANTGVVVVEGPGRAGWRLVDWRAEIADDLPATGLTDAGGR